jgi:geranylgeranyl diphosphate synthase type II
VQVSVAAGAIIAGASKEDIAACELFAEKIGLAFQSKQLISELTSLPDVFLDCTEVTASKSD